MKFILADVCTRFNLIEFTQSLNVEPHHFFLPKDYELKESSDVAAFAKEITDALESVKQRYLVK